MQITRPRLFELLSETSRSFSIGIQLLHEPLKTQLCLGYLLCRILDTYEDSFSVSPDLRIKALDLCAELLVELGNEDPASWQQKINNWKIQRDQSYSAYSEIKKWEQTLLLEAEGIFTEIYSLPFSVRKVFSESLQDMAIGMKKEVQSQQAGAQPQPRTLQELDSYCYSVAGTVGLLIHGLTNGASELKKTAVEFGKALQLVNIAKDFHNDWSEGRCFWPGLAYTPKQNPQLPEFTTLENGFAEIKELFATYVKSADLYIKEFALKQKDFYFFCVFPLEMAKKTFDKGCSDLSWLKNQGTFKLSRFETIALMANLGISIPKNLIANS